MIHGLVLGRFAGKDDSVAAALQTLTAVMLVLLIKNQEVYLGGVPPCGMLRFLIQSFSKISNWVQITLRYTHTNVRVCYC
jgi:hypothetical protein